MLKVAGAGLGWCDVEALRARKGGLLGGCSRSSVAGEDLGKRMRIPEEVRPFFLIAGLIVAHHLWCMRKRDSNRWY